MKKVRCLLLLAVMFVIGATAAQAEKNFRPQGGIIAGKGECAISGVETGVSSASAKNTIVGASAGVYNVDTSSDNLSALTALYEEALADYKQCISYKSSATPDADYATAEGGLITSASQLYSNAKEPLEGSFEALIDEASDPTTFFHSDWHGGSYTGSAYHYIGVAFDKAVQNVQFKMSKRMRTSRSSYSPYFPRRVQVYACNDTTDIDNAAWVLQGTLDVDWDYDIHEDFSTYSDVGKAGVALLSVPMDAAYKYVRLDVMPTYYRAVYFDLGALQAYEMQYDASASLIESVPADVRKAFEDQLASAKSAISAQKATADDVESLQKAYEDFIDNFMPKGNGKFYTIKLRAASPIVSDSCSLVWDASNSTISSRSSDSDLDKMGALWRFERVSASVSLVRLVTNAIGKPQYVDFVDVTDEGSAACLSDTGMVFRMSPCASGFRLKSVDYPGYYLSDYVGKLGSSTVEDDGGIFTVTLAAGQPSPVAFSATYEGVTIFSGEEAEGWYWKEGESVTAESDFFQTPDPSATHKGFSFSVSQDNAAFATGQSVMLTASWSVPFADGKFYTIKLRAENPSVTGSCSLVWDPSCSTISSRSSDSDLNKMGALWRFERVSASDNLVRLVTNAIGKPQYVDFVDVTDEGSAACLSDTGMVFRMSPCAGGYRLCSVDHTSTWAGSNHYLNDFDGRLGTSVNTDTGSTFTITLADEQPSPVTFTAMYDDATVFSGERAEGWYWKEGESVTEESDFFQTPDLSATHNGFSFTVSQDNAAFSAGTSVKLATNWSVPFEEGRFYTMLLRGKYSYYTGHRVRWNPGDTTVASHGVDGVIDEIPCYWRFERVAGTADHVRVVSNAIGKPQYITFADLSKNGSLACMTDTGTVFRVKPCNDGFRLCSPENDNYNLNDFGGMGKLGVWTYERSTTDEGSTFRIVPAEEQLQPVTFSATYDGTTIFSGEEAEGWYWKEGESVTAESDFFQTPDLSATHKGFSFSVSQDNAAFAASQSVMLTASRSVPFEEGKFYTMKVREGGTSSTDTIHSVVWNPSEGADIVHSQASDNDIDKMGAFWRFEFVSGTTDQVRVVSNAIGKPQYITIADMTADKSYACMTDTGTVFRVKPCNNGFRLCSPDNDLCNLNDLWGSIRDGSQGKLGIWINTDIDDYGSTFTITPAAVQPSPVTFSGTAGGIGTFDDMAAEGWYWKEGESVTAGSDFCQVPYDFYTVNADNPAFAEGTPVCLTASYPFPVSASYGPYNWTLLRTNDDDSHLCLRGGNGSAEVVTTGENSMDMSLLENVDKTARTGQWAFVCAGDEPNKFYLINRAGAFEHPVYRMGESGTLVPNSYLYDYGTAYSVGKQPAAVGSFTDGFTLACVTDGSPRLYDNGIYLSLGNEEVAEESRVFRTAEIDVPTAIATVEANTESYGGAGQGFVGEKVSSDEYLSALRATSTTSDFIEAYLTAAYRTPDPSKFYRITFTDGICPSGGSITADQYGTVNSDEQGMCRIAPVDTSDGAYSATSPAAISRIFPAVGYGKWVIQNVNSGVYWTDYVNDFSVGGDGTAYGIVGTENCDCNWALDCTTAVEDTVGAIVSLLGQHYDWSNPLSSFTDTNPATGCTGVRIQEVTECPLTFKAEYATLCLPFDVAVPYGVTAYKVTDATTTELVMEEIEGAISAGTGVILKGTPGETVSFAITSDAQNMSLHPAANNRLTGVNVQREGLAPRSFYGLAKKKGHIAFYLSDVTEMPANKAYLLVTDTQGTLSDLLDFNAGTPTGVNGAEVQSEADSIYYDLSGRRVLYPAHGVYVKGNGQKVFVK